jgi:hypothetical protein
VLLHQGDGAALVYLRAGARDLGSGLANTIVRYLSIVDCYVSVFPQSRTPRPRFSMFREHPPARSRSSNRTVIFNIDGGFTMARGDKSKYSSKQKRMAEHIEQGYKNGVLRA